MLCCFCFLMVGMPEAGMESDDTAGPDLTIDDSTDAAVSDLAYLRSRMRSELDDADDDTAEGLSSPVEASSDSGCALAVKSVLT